MQSIALTISRLATGFAGYSTFTWLFDYPLFTWVIWYFGMVTGGIIMIALSFAVDYYTLKFYDWSRTDWLALEYLKSHKSYEGSSRPKRLLKFLFTKTPVWVQVVLLSLKFNSFVVTVLLRSGSYNYDGLSSRDWRIFWLSFLVSQIYWIIIIGLGIEITESSIGWFLS